MRGEGGFTLLELLIVVAIVGVLLVIGVPGLRSLLQSSQRADAATSLYSGLVVAHSEAIVRNQLVTICQRAVSTTGSLNCDPNGQWTNGWVSYIGDPTVGVANGPANPTLVLGAGDATDPSFVVTTTTGSAPNFMQFLPNGHAVMSGVSVIFKLCNSQNPNQTGRLIEVGLSGRTALSACSSTANCCP